MLTSPNITGIDPFAPISTFTAVSINIPRGIFYGGVFYTAQAYTAPCHISYIQGAVDDYLGVWGVADQTGEEIGSIKFTNTPRLIGNIFTPDGTYAGCLVGRDVNFNAMSVNFTSSGSTSSTTYSNSASETVQDLSVFLQSIHGKHVLDTDTLVFDVGICHVIGEGNNYNNYPTVIQLPADCQLLADINGNYYAAPYGSSGDAESLPVVKQITVSGATLVNGNIVPGSQVLSGANVSITPWWLVDFTYDPATRKVTPTSGGVLGVADVVVDIHDNAVVVSDHATFGALE
jgi:hypothetical protein